MGVFLYRGRVLKQLSLLESDFLVFYLPLFLAFIANCVVFWSSKLLQAKPLFRFSGMLGVSVLVAFLSFWLTMVIALNTYGS